MLLQYGNTTTTPEWNIDEKIPLGYSRVYYVYSGEVEYEDNQGKTLLKCGYLYIFPSVSPYQMKQNLQNRLHCTFIHIDVFPALITDLIEVNIEGNLVLKYILLSIAASIDADDIKLIFALADVFETYCKEHNLFISLNKQISNLLLYIAEHIEEKISVENLCSLAGYNEQYFIRLFKQTIGLSPYQYIISYRLKEAKILLKTDISITQIARMTGYRDIKSFSRSFKENFGFSPTVYRNVYVVQP
ncbi:MAG TPA: AraC family transcriptional regulator [Clostridiaceae bacterium]